MKPAERLFIISGPSGAGEDSIITGLQAYFPIERVLTTTTRPPRRGESDGQPYYFISQEEFTKGIEAGKFFEYAKQYNGNLYGVTFAEIERVRSSAKIGIWKIDYQGVISAKKLLPDIISILIIAPLAVMEARIRRRDAVSEAFIAERRTYTEQWLQHTDIYDYTVENEDGKLSEAILEVKNIIDRHIRPTPL